LLEHHEYLQQQRDGIYQLSPRLISGWLVRAAEHVREVARPEMEKLVNAFNETVRLAYSSKTCAGLSGDVSQDPYDQQIGRVLPPHCSAMGKSITAFQDRALADRMLEVYGLTPRTEHTITDRKKLFAEFQDIRKSGDRRGQGRVDSSRDLFQCTYPHGRRPGGCSDQPFTPTTRMDKKHEPEVQAALLEAVTAISRSLAKD
jgi:DNA-binding IclR family transcriptional regulator